MQESKYHTHEIESSKWNSAIDLYFSTHALFWL